MNHLVDIALTTLVVVTTNGIAVDVSSRGSINAAGAIIAVLVDGSISAGFRCIVRVTYPIFSVRDGLVMGGR